MLSIGQELNNFRIEKVLGSGGMGDVYLAEDLKLNRRVALKTLRTEYFDDKERLERFNREARTLARLTHPNIMAVYEIDTAVDKESGRQINYLVTEFVEGQSLTTYLEEGKRDTATILRLGEKIATGLAAAHKENIVHRDIKADNVLVDAHGDPKILDFGLAKAVNPVQMDEAGEATDSISQDLTKVGKIVGTVSYMSPEQIRGETVDTRSDIFSFGILLFRMSTGKMPFSGDSQVSIMAKILESRQESIRSDKGDLPPELDRIIGKCLQKDPEDRYQDTRDLVVDLRNLRRQFDSGVTESISTEALPGGSKRRKFAGLGWRGTILVFFAMVFVFAIVMTLIEERPSGNSGELLSSAIAGENTLAILTFDNRSGDAELDWLNTGLPELLTTDLVQSGVTSLISPDRLIDYLNRTTDGTDTVYTYQQLLEAAKALGAVNVLSGSIFKLGENFRFDARLEEVATGQVVLGEKVVGADPFALVDSLTEKVATSLNLKERMLDNTDVEKFASSSPEAYKLYHTGMEKFEKGLYDESIALFNKALAIDSTFALPYMRIGMALTFQARNGSEYFSLAEKYSDRLPPKDRNLLDIYLDTWRDQDFDDAFAKMETMVKTYPEDKEARVIYAAMFWSFTSDSTKAFAQLDTALMIDPYYQLGLEIYAQTYLDLRIYDRAAEFYERMMKKSPQSPEPYMRLAQIYRRQENYDRAIDMYRKLKEIHKDRSDPVFGLANTYEAERQFDKARQTLAELPAHHGDDPYVMYDYYASLADLDAWEGKFKSAIKQMHKAVQEAEKTTDSTLRIRAYTTMAGRFEILEVDDSALYFGAKGYRWSNAFTRLNYPLSLVNADTALADSARVLFDPAIEDFKSRLPSGLTAIADGLELLFRGHASADTAQLIEALEQIINTQPGRGSGNEINLGKLCVLSGAYQKGLDHLLKFSQGDRKLSGGFSYPDLLYHIGLAYDGLGKTAEAVSYYNDMLSYWKNPEIEIRQIRNARDRLKRLTS